MILKDKVVLITGGSGILGRAFVEDVRSKGGIAVNLDITNETDISKDTIHFNLLDDTAITASLDLIMSHYGRIDGLVNNAYPRTDDWGSKFEETSPESFARNLEMQLSSVFTISKPIIKIMKGQGSGSLVHIASIYGIVGNDFTVYEKTMLTSPVAYSAIKGGLINFSRYLASYFGPHNIRSNCVSPGGIFNHQDPTFVKQYEHKVPMKRMGVPEDVAPVVSFLLSDEAKYITGQNIAVDGGWTAV